MERKESLGIIKQMVTSSCERNDNGGEERRREVDGLDRGSSVQKQVLKERKANENNTSISVTFKNTMTGKTLR